MTKKVSPDAIEKILGVTRQPFYHMGLISTVEEQVYILHSDMCRRDYSDLRECPFSLALDRGIDADDWDGYENLPVVLGIGIFHKVFPVNKVFPEANLPGMVRGEQS